MSFLLALGIYLLTCLRISPIRDSVGTNTSKESAPIRRWKCLLMRPSYIYQVWRTRRTLFAFLRSGQHVGAEGQGAGRRVEESPRSFGIPYTFSTQKRWVIWKQCKNRCLLVRWRKRLSVFLKRSAGGVGGDRSFLPSPLTKLPHHAASPFQCGFTVNAIANNEERHITHTHTECERRRVDGKSGIKMRR